MSILEKEEINYLSEKIKNRLNIIEQTHYNHFKQQELEEDYVEDYPGWTTEWLKKSIQELYVMISAYLEAKQMPILLNNFQKKFLDSITNDKKILLSGILHPEGDDELIITNEFRSFLSPFKYFDHMRINEENVVKLTSILKNTDFIIKNCNIEVVREADIYNQVKWVLGLYYPTCRLKNKASFIQEFKTYEPDILIPELKTAIEYKFISKASDNIDNFIDQVRTDANNYVGDRSYENFIAVIYLEDSSLATTKQIQTSWNSKNFPLNWELVVVIGSPTTHKQIITVKGH
ncbi:MULTISPECIES: hypothetical protein [Sphingobacterium]|uniref:PD-(D/E)XK nuclease domain-containing protein n=1 Tax=Sphingobacterium TaxID=28453 RepID=UPI0008A13F0C|nr:MULTISPECIES: hypothetical protein [Sphingobacterium]OFV12853.1 hypothetical protein HMPREF3127_15885 [Sphingobacterium sp. HMSC13C05]OJZ09528.1 MAG: hypothetical protein BGP15_26405 [Sphingobacterium sp. 40-24]